MTYYTMDSEFKDTSQSKNYQDSVTSKLLEK